MLLAKRQGGTTVRGHHWKNDDNAVEVPDDLAVELLAIKGGGFYVPEPDTGPDPAAGGATKAKAKQDAPAAPAASAAAAAKPAAAK